MKNFSLSKLSPIALVLGILLAVSVIQLIRQLFGDPGQFLNATVKGLALGGVYAMIALGFVIIFKATQVVNFAQGALAATGALFLSFLVFDTPGGDEPRGQTPGTWWRAPFAGEGFPDFGEQWASILLISLLAGILWAMLIGRPPTGASIGAGFASFLAFRWLATRQGFTWLDEPVVSLAIAIAIAFGVGMARGWKPSIRIAYGGAIAFVIMLVVAVTDSVWVEWIGNLFIALLFGAIFGMTLERIAIRPMVGQPLFSMAVITLGLEISIRQFSNDSVKILNRPVEAPWQGDAATGGDGGFLLGSGDNSFYNWSWIAILIVTGLSFLAVNAFYRSKLGVAMRAVSFDQEAAMAQGINVGQVFAIAWAFGASLAVLGGVFASQPPISEEGAVTVLTALVAFRALPAVILGGLDSVKGALIGGALIGLSEIYAGTYLSQWTTQPFVLFGREILALGAGYSQIVPFIVMMGVLLVRPYGLFGTPEVRRV